MIVLNKEQARKFGFVVYAKHLAYEPIEIKGDLFVLPDSALDEVIKKGLQREIREIKSTEWIKVTTI